MSLDKIKEYKIYDVSSKLVVELLEKEISLCRKSKVLVSLENIDTNKVIMKILKENIDVFLKGLNLIKEILRALEVIVILPLEFNLLEEKLRCKDVTVINEDFVKPNEYKDYLQLNFNTVINVGKVVTDTYANEVNLFIYNDNKLVSNCYNYGATFGEIISNYNSLMGLQVGYKYYDKSIFNEKLTEDFDYGDFVVKPIKAEDCIVTNTKNSIIKNSNISCGNCLFCREGLIHLGIYIDNITNNKGSFQELNFVEEIGNAMKTSNLCSIGNKGSDLALTGIKAFGEVYKEHIKDKKCSSNVCQSFNTMYIDPKLCTGCQECIDGCPVNCIDGKKGYIHMIDEFECTNCEKCLQVCDEEAIKMSDGKLPKLPRKLTKCGKFK